MVNTRSQSVEKETPPMETITEENVEHTSPTETPVAATDENLSLKAMLAAIRSELGSMRSELSNTRSEMSIMQNRLNAVLPSSSAVQNFETVSVPPCLNHPSTSWRNWNTTSTQSQQLLGPNTVIEENVSVPSSIQVQPMSSVQSPIVQPNSSVIRLEPSSVSFMPTASASRVTTTQAILSRSDNLLPEENSELQRDLSSRINPVITNASNFVMPTSNQSIPNLSFGGVRKKLYSLPQFSGNTEEWPIFEASFRESNTAFQYSQLENNFRLIEALKGRAKEAVEGLLLFPRNVEEVMRKLKFEFGRPELIVKCQLEKIRKIPPMDENSLDQYLLQFSNKVANMVTFIQSCGSDQHLGNPILLEELICKLPYSKRYEWIQYAYTLGQYATILDFNKWLTHVAELNAMLPVDLKRCLKAKSNQVMATADLYAKDDVKCCSCENEKRSQVMVTSETALKKFLCSLCEKDHILKNCETFQQLSTSQRWEHVKKFRICFSCLFKGHGLFNCRKKKKCTIADCSKFHHELLHNITEEQKSEEIVSVDRNVSTPQSNDNFNSKISVMKCDLPSANIQVLVKIIPIYLYGPKGKVFAYAFIDDGSQITMLNKSVADKLGLEGEPLTLHLKWLKNKTLKEESYSCDIKAAGVSDPLNSLVLKNTKIVEDMNLPVQSLNINDLGYKYKYLKGLPIAEQKNIVPDVLIGLDNLSLFRPLKQINGLENEPSAVKTPLGWVVYGPVCNSEANGNCHCVFKTHVLSLTEVYNMVSEYFTNDNLGIESKSSSLESVEDIRARDIMISTSKKKGTQFETGLLWKCDDIFLPESYAMAKSRLLSIERKMSSDAVYAEGYKRAVQAFIDKGYARKLSRDEIKSTSHHTWYLPHFGVTNVNKPGKIRVVFDAAARIEGTSLNDALLKGPDQYQPLLAILFRFREGEIGVCADIEEMFPQILIREEDRDAQRFLWREGDVNKKIDVYEMEAMTFGAKCSPCTAQFIKNLNALSFIDVYPEAVKEIIESHYVDDFVSSFKCEDGALTISKTVRDIHLKGGFNLRGFVSNSSMLCRNFNGESSAAVNMNMGTDIQPDKILGMFWITASDCFTFRFKYKKIHNDVLTQKRFPTKRELLALVMSVFDPFGFVANFLIQAKILLQEVWKAKVNWDDDVSEQIARRWYSIQNSLYEMEKIKIPRCYFLNSKVVELELHCFVDASETAMAAVCYFKIRYIDEQTSVSFVCGKTKCCPTKYMSIPRCELQAAVMGSRLKKSVLEFHRLEVKRTLMWTDSRTVLYWVKGDHKRYQQFVANRISEILDNTHRNEWYWVPSKLNPADEGTRDRSSIDIDSNRWTIGPNWLLDERDWPEQPTIGETSGSSKELRKMAFAKVLAIHAKFEVLFDVTRFSSYLKCVRSAAWVIRFKKNIIAKYKSEECVVGALTSDDLQAAEKWLCCQAQKEMFGEEYACIENGNPLPRTSKLLKHMPYKDEDNILRVRGRIDNCDILPVATKRPMILHKHHDLTILLVKYFHDKFFHQNEDVIICELQRKFWIDGLRMLVRKIGNECMICKIIKARPYQPIMGQLPPDRLTPYVRPFTYCGLDYFGPVLVSVGRRIEKRWVALFTCLTIRAIHMEIAPDLTADSCILCIRNFMNFRGTPVRIRTDNGSNLIGAKNEMIKARDFYGHIKIKDKMSSQGIEWLTNTPQNPCEGGCWERMIRSVKRILKFVLKEKHPKEESLRSFLYEAMNIMNSRPLTHIPIESFDDEPLTPNHYLLGCANTIQTPLPDGVNFSLRKQWRIIQQMSTTFWKRWISEFLPVLTGRSKWYTNETKRTIAKNDVVIICDDMAMKNTWEKAVVVDLIPDRSGVVRKVKIKTSSKILERPVSKLAVLDVASGKH